MTPYTIGRRAALEIACRISSADQMSVSAYFRQLGIDRKMFYRWWREEGSPSAKNLQLLALNGYDVHYILTGKRKATPEAATSGAAQGDQEKGMITSNYNIQQEEKQVCQ